jgi:hypothetical protein
MDVHRARSTATPRWQWSGVEELRLPVGSRDALRSVAARLPSTQSERESIVFELLYLGARYHRYLHQDEFGPSRAQQTAALRTLLQHVNAVISRFEQLPDALRSAICQTLDETLKPSSGGFDTSVLDQLNERLDLAVQERTGSVDLANLHEASRNAYEHFLALDTTTEGALCLDAVARHRTSAPKATGVCDRLTHLRRQLEKTLQRLQGRRGPAPATSMKLLVWQLGGLWERETGRAVTSNAVKEYIYTSRPQSAAGRFIEAAVEALMPSGDWKKEHEYEAVPVRARGATGKAADRARLVHHIVRDYVKLQPPDRRRRAGRKPKQTL